MPGARLELAQGFNSPTDFKSVASADSAIRAIFLMKGFKKMEARGGIEPPHIGFADRCITTLLPRLDFQYLKIYGENQGRPGFLIIFSIRTRARPI